MPDHAAEVDVEPVVTRFTVQDSTGSAWRCEVWWALVESRAGAVHLAATSADGTAANSTVLRALEQAMRAHTPPRNTVLPDGYRQDGTAYRVRRDERPLTGVDLTVPVAPMSGAQGPPPRGRPRDDEAWRARVLAVLNAWEARQPLLAALERLEPGASPSTYRARLRGVYQWDREHGQHVLRDVGRNVRPGKGGSGEG